MGRLVEIYGKASGDREICSFLAYDFPEIYTLCTTVNYNKANGLKEYIELEHMPLEIKGIQYSLKKSVFTYFFFFFYILLYVHLHMQFVTKVMLQQPILRVAMGLVKI